MKIKKIFQGSIPENKILNSHSTSQTDTYSCEKINEITENLITHKYQLKITDAVTAGTEVTIPCYYKVGQAVIDVYLNGERLSLSSDDLGTDGHYREVGTADSISNKIKTTTDWTLESGDVLDFLVRGDYNET